jgi:hypothetical protein
MESQANLINLKRKCLLPQITNTNRNPQQMMMKFSQNQELRRYRLLNLYLSMRNKLIIKKQDAKLYLKKLRKLRTLRIFLLQSQNSSF